MGRKFNGLSDGLASRFRAMLQSVANRLTALRFFEAHSRQGRTLARAGGSASMLL